jgi:NAD+ diphosphatase
MWVLTGGKTSLEHVTFPHLRLAANPHDRTGLRRSDDAWLEQRWADRSSRVLVVSGTRVRPVDGRLEWVAPQDAPEGLRVLLGEQDGTTYFAVVVDPARAPGEKSEWFGLRGVLPHLAGDGLDEAPLVFHAIGLAEWLFATRFCPRCAGPLEPRAAGHELVCTSCGKPQFPRTDPAVIMVVTSGEPGWEDERFRVEASPLKTPSALTERPLEQRRHHPHRDMVAHMREALTVRL